MIGDPFFDMLMAKREGGDALFTTVGSHSWIVPIGVTSVCVVCVGGGAGGGPSYPVGLPPAGGAGGDGGGLVYCNNIAVTPGTTCTIAIPNVSAGDYTTYFRLPGSPIKELLVNGRAFSAGYAISGYVAHYGGLGGNSKSASGGSGGGGAAGYLEDGGNAGSGTLPSIDAAAQGGVLSGGAGGGGGGGIGLYGTGSYGASKSSGGSRGTNGQSDTASVVGGNGGLYGGGGGGGGPAVYSASGGVGGGGAVRIIWGPDRSFPYNAGPI